MVKYRGKYPYRIESTWVITHKHYETAQVPNGNGAETSFYKEVFPQYTPGMYCRTNNGRIFKCNKESLFKPGYEITDYDEASHAFIYIEQSTKRS